MIKPSALKKGDTIGIISPCFSFAEDEKAIVEQSLLHRGYGVKYGKNLFSLSDSYCASAKERADDFNAMISDDDVSMILFEGGEVSNELIPLIDYESIKKHPKIICSYSDSTSILNVITCRSQTVTYYGQSWRGSMYSDYNLDWFNMAFCRPERPVYKTAKGLRCYCKGKASGRLIGGYLLNFSLLMGNPYFSYCQEEKHILFLEDNIAFNSPPAVSRYLSNIDQSDFFKTVSGVIIGHYSPDFNYDFDFVIKKFADKWNLPVVKCEDFGHGEYQAILPIGQTVELDATAEKITFLESFTK